MEETLVTTAVDLSGRYYLVFQAAFPTPKIGDFDSELVEDFWQAVAANCLCNLHVIVHYGRNSHHISEAIFKATARALRMAVEPDPRMHRRAEHQGHADGLRRVCVRPGAVLDVTARRRGFIQRRKETNTFQEARPASHDGPAPGRPRRLTPQPCRAELSSADIGPSFGLAEID